MSINKQVLSLAIFGALVSGNALAADLSANPVVPAVFAKEIVIGASGTQLMTTASTAGSLTWRTGYNFSVGEVRYARLECSDTIELDAGTVSISNPANASLGSINGAGTNVLTFSITSAGSNVVQSDVLTLNGDHTILSTDSVVTCAVGLYDQPSQAQAGGSNGLIAGSHFSGAYITFSPSYRLAATPTTHTASVEALPAYSRFIDDDNGEDDQVWLGWDTLTYGLADPAGPQATTLGVDGLPITLAALLASTSTMELEGDFSIAANTDGSFTGAALGFVKWYTNNNWTHSASALTASKATFAIGNTATVGDSSIDLNTNTTANRAIPESEYTLTLKAVAGTPGVYAVNNLTIPLGRIVRDGTQLQAPLAQVPASWISRMVLTNTGNVARPYTVAVMGETGNIISTDATKLTGMVPANGTVVVDLNGVLTGFTAAPRATLNVTVAGPDKQIQGLYQIVNPEKGSISNHAMLRPGTN